MPDIEVEDKIKNSDVVAEESDVATVAADTTTDAKEEDISDADKKSAVEEKPKRGRRKKVSEESAVKKKAKKPADAKKNVDADTTAEKQEKPKRVRKKKAVEETAPKDKPATKKKSDEKSDESLEKKPVENDEPVTVSTPEKKSLRPTYKNDEREKVFALDIGTRSVIGIVALRDKKGNLEVIATTREEHKTRAMLDGQIHDVPQVAEVIEKVRDELSKHVGKLTNAAVAAAGRALFTMTADVEMDMHGVITEEQQSNLNFTGVQIAQSKLVESNLIDDRTSYCCVGFSVISYELDGVPLKILVGQRGRRAQAKIIATFLPRQVIDSMQTALNYTGMEMRALTLEPIAAINVLIPQTMRHLNLVLVDIGAGTSDVAITKNGAVVAYGMVPIAGDEITEALSQKFLLDFNVAEEVKRKASNGESATFFDILGEEYNLTADEIVAPISETISNLANAISESILELNSGELPQAVILVGGGSLTPKLAEYVSDALKIPAQRVKVRTPVNVEGMTGIPKELCRPDAVTPLGILKIASSNTLHFLTVYVNDEEYSLFHFRELTVSDALLTAGIQLRKLNGKPGLGLMVMINGEKKIFPGSMGTLAKLTVNGELATLETHIKNDSRIKVEHGIDGRTPKLRVADVVIVSPNFYVKINGSEEPVTPKLLVNNEDSLPNRLLHDGDEINTTTLRTVAEVLNIAGYPAEGRQIHYTLNEQKFLYSCSPKITLNDLEVPLSEPVRPNDRIEYIDSPSPKVADIISYIGINAYIKINYEGQEVNIPTMASLELKVNGRPANLNTIVEDGAEVLCKKTSRKSVTVSDALLAVKFNPPNPKSRLSFEIKVNGHPVDFTDSITEGDKLEVVLRTPDGKEISSSNSLKAALKEFDELASSLPSNSTPMREMKTQRKLTIQDFIRND